MSAATDLARLLALRSLREERAQTAVAGASARLQEAIRVLAEADSAIDRHEQESGERERRFFEAMQIRPVRENELGRRQDVLRVSEHRLDTLIDSRNLAAEAVAECRRQLDAHQQVWRLRLAERDKLAEAERHLRIAGALRREAIAEMDAEDMGADRARLAC